MKPRIIRLESGDSTNTVLGAMTDAVGGTVVATRTQTAGRGQRGNSWESEPGRNLTFSMLLTTGWPARRQFELSMLVALAIADSIDAAVLSRLSAGEDSNLCCGDSEAHAAIPPAKVKWPNDIYVGDRKICGILIEHRLSGSKLERSIAGIGININQRRFVSDAPNPVSVVNLLEEAGADARPFDLDALLADVAARICTRINTYCLAAAESGEALKAEYMSRLWRADGAEYPFALPDGTTFSAAIVDVASDGILTLTGPRHFAFKEVSFLID